MNWDTEEVIDWFLNDEGLYMLRKATAEYLEDIWREFAPTKEVDVDAVDWDNVSEFFENE